MNSTPIKKIIIVGGGTSGWMAAASLSKFLSHKNIEIHLVESNEIGTIGVGEATLPGILDFNNSLGIDQINFIKKTKATFKLGIEFNDWKNIGTRFFHPFSSYGLPLGGVDFYQIWQVLFKQGKASALENYCLPSILARQNKFSQPNPNTTSPLANYHYAFHFDASLYANYLRDYSEARGVIRHEDKVTGVNLADNGFIAGIKLEHAGDLAGDLFIDCTGFKGLLIEGALKTGYEDWSEWLPVNSAVAVQSESTTEPTSYTKTTALEAGWKWKIPLQHRTGNGYVYCDKFISDADATQKLLLSLDGKPLTTPKVIKFTTGRRKKFWNKNCVALGLSSGFLEPLESTSISLIQTGISKLLMFFPDRSFNENDMDEANRLAQVEMERIRDFILLHYKLSQRNDSPFWNYVQEIPIPEALQQKINMFKRRGHLIKNEGESFGDASWISIYNGFNIIPETFDLRVEQFNIGTLGQQLEKIETTIKDAASYALHHQAFIERYCKADL